MSSTFIHASKNSYGQDLNADTFFSGSNFDGSVILVTSDATNVAVDGYGRNSFLIDLESGSVSFLDYGPDGRKASGSDWRQNVTMSPHDDNHVYFTTSGFGDGFNLYQRDLAAGVTQLIGEDISKSDNPLRFPLGETWHSAHIAVANDGSKVLYSTTASTAGLGGNNYTQIVYYNTQTGEKTLLSTSRSGEAGVGNSLNPHLSNDGRYLGFTSSANNLTGDASNSYFDAYIKDLTTGEVRLLSKDINGLAANGRSVFRGFSDSGEYAVFDSDASDLIASDRNYSTDVFLYHMTTGEITRVSERQDGTESNSGSGFSGFLPGSNRVSFITSASNLIDNDTNGSKDVVFFDPATEQLGTYNFDALGQPNNNIDTVGFSANGEYAFLTTGATNLVASDRDTARDVIRVPVNVLFEELQIRGTAADDHLEGTAGNDVIVGEAGNDFLNAGDGDDILLPGSGSDSVSGGNGFDTVRYLTDSSGFTSKLISVSDNRYLISNVANPLENDTLQGVELVTFADRRLSFETDATPAEAYRLYKAAFDRTPDEPGLGYWIDELSSGMNIQQVAQGFVDSAEFKTLYGAYTNDQAFITLLYNNVLDRTPDAAGFDYWEDEIERGMARSEMLVSFSESRENINNTAALIEDGIWFV